MCTNSDRISEKNVAKMFVLRTGSFSKKDSFDIPKQVVVIFPSPDGQKSVNHLKNRNAKRIQPICKI